eukprot:3704093-Rhodomonas_salina.2
MKINAGVPERPSYLVDRKCVGSPVSPGDQSVERQVPHWLTSLAADYCPMDVSSTNSMAFMSMSRQNTARLPDLDIVNLTSLAVSRSVRGSMFATVTAT